jgi:DNA-binding Lrp family transcriptional regulator
LQHQGHVDPIGLMVRAITESGPNIAQISQRLGIPKETLRYWYKGLLNNSGFAVQAIANQEALGLKRMVCIVEFDDQLARHADPILASLNDSAYLVSFARTMPDNLYIVNFGVPESHIEAWTAFMNSLKLSGIFRSLEILEFDWVRVAPMSVNNYDFDSDRWEFDWTNTTKPERNACLYTPSPPSSSFDSVDLAIIQQLQRDGNRTLVEIRSDLKVNYKTLTWHWREHLKAGSLIRGYQVNWAGTRYDFETETPMHRKHRYLPVELILRNLTEAERNEAMGKINSLPFLWLEAVGKNYYCKLLFPIESLAMAMKFIGELLAPVKSKTSWFLMDQSHALGFTIPATLYSDQTGWTFQPAGMLAKFEELILKIKGTG